MIYRVGLLLVDAALGGLDQYEYELKPFFMQSQSEMSIVEFIRSNANCLIMKMTLDRLTLPA